jgi:hypothetical protein
MMQAGRSDLPAAAAIQAVAAVLLHWERSSGGQGPVQQHTQVLSTICTNKDTCCNSLSNTPRLTLNDMKNQPYQRHFQITQLS